MSLRPLMSDAEIRHRKKVQGKISVATSTLGLGALALKGGGGVARMSRFGAKGAKLAEHLDRGATNTLVGSAGIGGLGGYNFAAYTKAESRKKQPMIHKALTPVAAKSPKPPTNNGPKMPTPPKPATPVAGPGAFGPQGYQGRKPQGVKKSFKVINAKKIKEAVNTVSSTVNDADTLKKKKQIFKAYDSEEKRAKRLTGFSTAAAVGSGAAATGALIHGRKAKALTSLVRNPAYKKALGHGGKAAGLTAVAAATAVGSHRLKEYHRRSGGSYRPLY